MHGSFVDELAPHHAFSVRDVVAETIDQVMDEAEHGNCAMRFTTLHRISPTRGTSADGQLADVEISAQLLRRHMTR